MKKSSIIALAAVVMMSGCGTYTGSGAYTGASLGSILGSAIGGISGGPRGSDIGTIVGMASGAIVGGAIGQRADQQRDADMDQYRRDKADRAARRQQRDAARQQYNGSRYQDGGGTYAAPADSAYDYVYDPAGGGDDRLYDFSGSDYTGNYSAQPPTTQLPATSSVEDLAEGLAYTPHIEIRNARIVDANQDGTINRGELCKVIFEVYNTGQKPILDIQPTVLETTGNRHIFISPGMHVERLMPGAGIRYTAMLKAYCSLKNGNALICVSVVQGTKAISKVVEFNVPTSKQRVKE